MPETSSNGALAAKSLQNDDGCDDEVESSARYIPSLTLPNFDVRALTREYPVSQGDSRI